VREETVMILLPIRLPFSTNSSGTTLQDKFNLEFKTDHTDDPGNALKVYKDGLTYQFAKWSMTTEAMMPPPRYLLFGYKRFDLNYATFQPIKLNDAVMTPLQMLHPACYQRPAHLNNSCNWHYLLEAVVQHVGSEADGGHYISAVRGRGSAEERHKWYYVSDSIVREITPLELQKIADKCFYAAYVLADGDNSLNDVLEAGDKVTKTGLTSNSVRDLHDRYGKSISSNHTAVGRGVELSDGMIVAMEGNDLEMRMKAGEMSSGDEQPAPKKPRGVTEPVLLFFAEGDDTLNDVPEHM